MRLLLLLSLLFGLCLPRAGALLGELAGFETVVICTGDELITLTIGPDGTPVGPEIEEHGPCLAALTPPGLTSPNPAWTRLAADIGPPARDGSIVLVAAPWRGPPPDRGPPVWG